MDGFLSQLAVALPEEQNPEDPFDTVMTQFGQFKTMRLFSTPEGN